MQLRYGTTISIREGRLVQVVDRVGHVHAELVWTGDTLDRLVVTGALVHGQVITDPLLGDAHAIAPVGTAMSAVSWSRPTQIPAIADPARLPPGAGGAILNVLAHLARSSDVPALRYAGPYPTAALFRSLGRSFRTTATEAEFTADIWGRASRLARDELPIDFAPDPCERVVIPGGWVELRDGLERVVHHGVTFERAGATACLREVPGSPAWAAEVWFGDAPYARIATFSLEGELLDGPHPIPPCRSAVIGREFPAPLRAALADLVAEAVPAPLADAARATIADRPIVWADLGPRAAQRLGAGFALHAALWERIAPLGLARLALALAEALAPVVTVTNIGELARRSSTSGTFGA